MKIGITERGDAGVHINEVLRVMPNYTGVILVTKNPGLLIPHLETMDKMHPYGNNKCYIIHSTITGYGGTALEPNVPSPKQAINDYYTLVSKLGGNRVVLRIDPIIPTEKGLEVAYDILAQARGRVRISFFDAYGHALQRMSPGMRKKLGDVYHGELHAPLELRLAAFNTINEMKVPQTKKIEVCGEPGLVCTGCISLFDMKAMSIDGDIIRTKGNQRAACQCLASKSEMLTHRGQCKHGCLYCYWR